MPDKRQKFTPEQQRLRDMLNVRPIGTSPGTYEDEEGRSRLLPTLPPAHPFRPGPMIVGQDLIQSVMDILRIAPELRGQIPSIIHGPTIGSMKSMMGSGLKPDEFAFTNLLGVTDTREGSPTRNQIGINPRLRDTGQFSPYWPNLGSPGPIVAHEMAHAVGEGEAGAGLAEALYSRIQGKPALSQLGAIIRQALDEK